MAIVKVKYTGQRQVCFCDAANDKNLLFSKADIRLDRRVKDVEDGPWLRGWLAGCADLSVIDESKPVERPVEQKVEMPEQKPVYNKYQAQRKQGPKGK